MRHTRDFSELARRTVYATGFERTAWDASNIYIKSRFN